MLNSTSNINDDSTAKNHFENKKEKKLPQSLRIAKAKDKFLPELYK